MEKLQVQVAAVAALALGWFAAWPLLKPWDGENALVFLPGGDIGRLLGFAACVWVIAAVSAALTLSARASAAMLATLFGASALALRSGSMATLLQQTDNGLKGVFSLLAIETIVLAGVLIGAMVVVALVRAAAKNVVPDWRWPDDADPRKGKKKRTGRWSSSAANIAACMIIELAIAIMILTITFKSIESGQVAFSLAMSFFVAALIAHHMFPVEKSWAYWIPPLVVGAAVLSLGGIVVRGGGPEWHQAVIVAKGLPLRAALPIHWLALGCGGAMLGLWVAQRMRLPAPIVTE